MKSSREVDGIAESKTREQLSVFKLAQSLGFLRIARHLRRRSNRLLILCYHGISKSDEHIWKPSLYMHPALFRRRLQQIHQMGFQVLPLAEALAEMSHGDLRSPTVAITFDDGWHDFYSVAWPLLREFGYPATVYQTTYYASFNRPVFDTTLSYLLWRAKGQTVVNRELTGNDAEFRLNSDRSADLLTQLIRTRVRHEKLSAQDKDNLLVALARQTGANFQSLLSSRTLHLMNATELKAISQTGMDVQLHSHRHELPLDRESFLQEIQINREQIRRATGKEAVHFCYPNGFYRTEFKSWLQEAEVKSAVTCEPGIASRRTEALLLPRVTDSMNVSGAKFEAWLSGVGLIGSAFKRVIIGPCPTPAMPMNEPVSQATADTTMPAKPAAKAAGMSA